MGQWLDIHDQQIRDNATYAHNTKINRCATVRQVRAIWGHHEIEGPNYLKPHEVATGLKTIERSHKAVKVFHEIRDAYAGAIANGWAEMNPAAHLKPPKHKVQRARLSFEIWIEMCIAAQSGRQHWIESMLLLALVTGQRRADLAKMRFDDIVADDDGNQYLHVEQQKQAGKGYGARVAIPLTLQMNAIDMTVADVIEHCRNSAKPGPTLLRIHGGGAIEMSSLSARFHETIVQVLGKGAHATFVWPSLHEVRSLSARTYKLQGVDTQTLLGHKHAEMTELYEDDRGLSAKDWKRVGMKKAPEGAF